MEKIGFDDFFNNGGTVEDLHSLATDELLPYAAEDEEEEENPCPYEMTENGIFWEKENAGGTTITPLTNFRARIVSDIERDDGRDTSRTFRIKAGINGTEKDLEISSPQFTAMNWPTKYLGADAIIYPGFSIKEHARCAIQMISEGHTKERIYEHTGWRIHDGKNIYLSASGGINETGKSDEMAVDLQGELAAYSLPAPPDREALKNAVKDTVDLLKLLPEEIAVTLIASVFRAPLNHACASNFSVHLTGHTGSLKSEIAALFQGFYGKAFTSKNLPGAWESTENALEKMAFLAKDTLFVVDDYVPEGSSYDASKLQKKAARLLRGAGNQAGRNRMNADKTLNSAYYARCIILSTGEDVPPGQSLRARMMIFEVNRSEVNLPLLTTAQKKRDEGMFTSCMAGYIKWLAPKLENMKNTLSTKQQRYRSCAIQAASEKDQHMRTPDIVASLMLGWDWFMDFAEELGVVTIDDGTGLRTKAWEALLKAGKEQSQFHKAEDPVIRFIMLLSSVITSGHAHIIDSETGVEPNDAAMWGWKTVPAWRDGYRKEEWQPQGERIGWLSEADLYLDPESSFAAVQKVARNQSAPLMITQRTLWKRLAEKNILASIDDGRKRNVVRKVIQGKRRTVLHLKSETIVRSVGKSGPTGPMGPGPPEKK